MSTQLSVVELRILLNAANRCLHAVVVLLALQIPMWVAVAESTTVHAASTPARLSLLLDVGFALALMMLAIRSCELVRARRPERWVLLRSRWASGGLILAGALNLVENVVLWQHFGSPDMSRASLVVVWISPVWALLAVLSAAMLAQLVRWAEHSNTAEDPLTSVSLSDEAAPDHDDVEGTVIACSGGGIRSASFCLGALQSLMKSGEYHRASAVVGVSGGGYMAAAFHLVGRDLGSTADPPFAQGTPELGLLRRNTRYLLPRGTVIVRGLMSVLYGVLVNLTIILVTLHALAWLLGWYLAEFGVVREVDAVLTVETPMWWVLVALAPWVVLSGEFVLLDKVVDRFVPVPDRLRSSGQRLASVLVPVGTATVLLMLAVPYSLWALDRQVGSDEPLLNALSVFVQPWAHGWPSLGSALAVVVALVGLGRTVITGLGAVGEGSRLSSVISTLRVVVAPWLGTAVIVLGGALMLLSWTAKYAIDADWRSDWGRALWLLGTVLLIRVLTDANRTSLHHFYRERLSTAFLVERQGVRKARRRPYQKPIRVSEFARPNGGGGPELVMAAAANVVDQDLVPSGRGCVPFIIAADRTGVVGDRSLPPHGTARTKHYEAFADYGGRDLTLPAAMAISGAAFSPLTGRASARTRPVRLLLTVLNARLGVWLPNPYGQPPMVISRALRERARFDVLDDARRTTTDSIRVWCWEQLADILSVAAKPGPYRLLREAFGRPSLYDRKLYVTDGGHYDNLGLLEALRRRPQRIIVIDASNDEENSFGALSEAIATARMDLGVEVVFDTRRMTSTVTPSGTQRAVAAWSVGTATHSDGQVSDLLVLKALLTDNLTTDLEHYARENPDFPRRSTGRQLYDEWDFEAYRALGTTLADDLVRGSGLGVPSAIAPTGGAGT